MVTQEESLKPVLKAQSHIPSRTSSAQKNEEFWAVRCDLLVMRQNLLKI